MPLTPAPSFIHLGVISAGRQRGPGVHQADHGARLPLACKKQDKGSNAAREQGPGGRGTSRTQPGCSGIAAGLCGWTGLVGSTDRVSLLQRIEELLWPDRALLQYPSNFPWRINLRKGRKNCFRAILISAFHFSSLVDIIFGFVYISHGKSSVILRGVP